MKVLLINPNRTYASLETAGCSLGLPLGLLYIAASLEKHCIPVSVLDCQTSPQTRLVSRSGAAYLGIDPEAVRSRLLADRPDIVGVTCQFTAQWENALEIVRLASETTPNCTVVLGGPHATVCGVEILQTQPEVHYILAGEGELTFPRLVAAIETNDLTALNSIPGLMRRDDNGGIAANPVKVIENLDELPLPAYHLVDFDRLFELQRQGLFARSNRTRSVSVITSRGCPYTCTFCSIHLSMGHRWRAHSVEYTINHIKHLKDNYGVCHLNIEDDNFTFKNARAREICSRLIAEHMGLTWDTPNGVRADTLDDDLVAAMTESGCVHLVVAAESGAQDVVTNIVKKRLDLKHIERAVALASKHDIPMGCFFVIGFPGETKKQIGKTMEFAANLYSRYKCVPMLNVATPLPGTELARIVQSNGYLVRQITPSNLGKASSGSGLGMIKTPEFDPEYLRSCLSRLRRRIRVIHFLRLLHHPGELRAEIRRKWRRVARRPMPAN
jgi:radical SAM superfamily enzyme YgiQ (UPF0313 family)